MTNLTMRFTSSALTDQGLSEKRPVNEDSYLELAERGLFAVADGVGGAQAGDLASQTAMEVLKEAFSNPHPEIDTEELLEMAIQRANASIYQMSKELPQLDMMATTIVALSLEDNIATIGHVGDSRLYRLDAQGNLLRETQDHSMVEDEVRAGRLTPEQAVNHPNRNVISRALGAEDSVEVDMKTIMFNGRTTFLLCSDGITRHVSDEEIRRILLEIANPDEICRHLKNLCYERGAEDNLTAVVIKAERNDAFSGTENDLPTVELRLPKTNAVAAFGNRHELDEDESTIAAARPAATFSGVLNRTFNQSDEISAARETPDSERTIVTPPPSQAEQKVPETNAPLVSNSVTPETNAPHRAVVQTNTFADENSAANKNAVVSNNVADENVESSRTYADNRHHNDYKSSRSKGGFGLPLLLLLLGLGLGAGLHWLWSNFVKTPAEAVTTAAVVPTPDPSMLEFNTFEKSRRNVDTTPAIAEQYPTDTASSLYLRARGAFAAGNFDKSAAELTEAVKNLPNANDVNREMLRREINILANALVSKTAGAKRAESAAAAEATK